MRKKWPEASTSVWRSANWRLSSSSFPWPLDCVVHASIDLLSCREALRRSVASQSIGSRSDLRASDCNENREQLHDGRTHEARGLRSIAEDCSAGPVHTGAGVVPRSIFLDRRDAHPESRTGERSLPSFSRRCTSRRYGGSRHRAPESPCISFWPTDSEGSAALTLGRALELAL